MNTICRPGLSDSAFQEPREGRLLVQTSDELLGDLTQSFYSLEEIRREERFSIRSIEVGSALPLDRSGSLWIIAVSGQAWVVERVLIRLGP